MKKRLVTALKFSLGGLIGSLLAILLIYLIDVHIFNDTFVLSESIIISSSIVISMFITSLIFKFE